MPTTSPSCNYDQRAVLAGAHGITVMAKRALWAELVERGFFADKDTATRRIMTGAVLVDNQRVDKPGTPVVCGCAIRIKGIERRYVGRGGEKLAGALAHFQLDVTERVALDTGASTGGFTDCLLQHGAAKVYSIDVGYGQLAGILRNHPRVVNMERTNIGDVKAADLQPLPSLATVDLSYLSLKKAVPIITTLLTPEFDILCLVKPLFEVEEQAARRTGIIAAAAYPAILRDVTACLQGHNLHVCGITRSCIQGHNKTDEFFLWLQPARGNLVGDMEMHILQAVST